MLVDDAPLGRAYGLGELLEGGRRDGLHAVEVAQQFVLGLGAYTLDVVQARGELALAALVAVEGDGEAVHLGLDLLQQAEGRAVVLHGDLVELLLAIEEGGGAVALVLDEARHGDVELEDGQRVTYSADLPLAPVGEDEVG